MTRIRGRALLGVLRFANEQGFPGGTPGLLSQIPEDSRAVFSERIRTSKWYPYPVYISLLTALDRSGDETGASVVRQLGHFSLRGDAGSILKILRVFSSVEALVTRGFGAWGSFLWGRHCDTGRVFLLEQGNKTATMGIDGFATIDPVHCLMIAGYLEEMGRQVGASSIRMSHTECVHRGGDICAFRGSWD